VAGAAVGAAAAAPHVVAGAVWAGPHVARATVAGAQAGIRGTKAGVEAFNFWAARNPVIFEQSVEGVVSFFDPNMPHAPITLGSAIGGLLGRGFEFFIED